MRDPGAHPPDPHEITTREVACELLGVLAFGARGSALARCPRLAEQVDGCDDLGRTATALVEAIETFTDPVPVPDRHPEPIAPALVRRMLHVLLATRDLGWPGIDAPLSVRRVAAADLFFDATQTVLADGDWKGPDGVEFALLTALAERICRAARLRAAVGVDEERARDTGVERLGHVHRVQRPRGL